MAWRVATINGSTAATVAGQRTAHEAAYDHSRIPSADQYAALLTDGTKALLKKYPEFRLDVYPTHRTAAAPAWVYENTFKNATRAKLKARMKARSYDDIALIERDRIQGQAAYAPEIRDMHFGPGAVCRTVTRSKWTATTQERGLVYCEDGQCILVPTVCRNVSRIRRLDKPSAVAPASRKAPATAIAADRVKWIDI